MKCTIPEISWHNRDPVLSVDFQVYNGEVHRFATGGTDTHVLIWFVQVEEDGSVTLEFVSDLKRHNRAVNVVRFSPCGAILASGDDEAAIFLWKQTDSDPANDLFADEERKENKEHWSAVRTLRGHIDDVYDLNWSPDSKFLVSGSVDNSAIIWDANTGRNVGILRDHKGFVQGVAWDPQNKYVATLCSDRTCRVYNAKSYKIAHKLCKANLLPTTVDGEPADSESVSPCRATRLFHDDTLKSFFRRLSFTPDGELLIAPSGIVEKEDGSVVNVTHVFSRHSFAKPVFYLPSRDAYTLAVRCCPTLFQLRPVKRVDTSGSEAEVKPWELYSTMLKLPYRMIFAVATQNSVLFYDTQQPVPFAKVSNIQYTRLSDISWSSDGRILIVSSTDGYCSFVTFRENELGTPYKDEARDELRRTSGDVTITEEAKTSPDVTKEILETTLTPSPIGRSTKTTPTTSPSQKTPGRKRVSLITLFSPKEKSATQRTKSGGGNDAGNRSETSSCKQMEAADKTSNRTFESMEFTDSPSTNDTTKPVEQEIEVDDSVVVTCDVMPNTSNSDTNGRNEPAAVQQRQPRRIELITLSSTTKSKSKTEKSSTERKKKEKNTRL